MSRVGGIGGPDPARIPASPGAARGGFSVSLPPPEAGGAARAAAAMPPSALGCMLALQEGGGESVGDRQARRRGQALLRALSCLQRSLLRGGDDVESLQDLTGLAADLPEASSPALRGILDQIVLRARVELARRAP